MFHIQALLGLVMAGIMATASAAGPGYLGNPGGQTFTIGNTLNAAASFNDEYRFDILPASTVIGIAVTINLDIPQFAGQAFAIENFAVAFKGKLNNTIASDFQTSPTDHAVSVSAFLPSAPDYRFVVSGNVTGASGGSYGGVLQAAPAPEPKAGISLIAGLGLIGLKLGRFKRRMF